MKQPPSPSRVYHALATGKTVEVDFDTDVAMKNFLSSMRTTISRQQKVMVELGDAPKKLKSFPRYNKTELGVTISVTVSLLLVDREPDPEDQGFRIIEDDV